MKKLAAVLLCSVVLASAASINVAASANGGVASQSSTYTWNTHALNANDGNTNQDYHVFPYIAITRNDDVGNPWWEVAFADNYLIDSIKIWFRTDCCHERIDGFNLFLYDVNGTTVFSALNQSPHATTRIYDVPSVGVVARKLRVWHSRQEYLEIGEVQAFHNPVPEPSTLGMMLAGALGALAWRRRG